MHIPDRNELISRSIIILFLTIAALAQGRVAVAEAFSAQLIAVQSARVRQQDPDEKTLFIPLLQTANRPVGSTSSFTGTPRVNAPFFESNLTNSRGAIFWFGRVTSEENYADVRVGYTPDGLYVRINVFDRFVWFERSPSPDSITNSDSTSLYLRMSDSSEYRFDAQVTANESQPAYQAAFIKTGSIWQTASIPFNVESFWRGNATNDDLEDNGWWLNYHIPFSSLGLSGAPSQGSLWKMGIKLYDRDDPTGSPRPIQAWPSQSLSDNTDTWGELAFGLPVYFVPDGAVPAGTTIIRHKLNGTVVKDAMVGGGTLCGQGIHFWNEWGETNYAGMEQVNIQNQLDVADWPCFSKLYLTFPIGSVPAGKVIISADLVLHHFGNSGGGDYGDPPVSLIQVLTVAGDWDENTLTWNNAPMALENVSRARVEPILELADWRGLPRSWDVSMAVNQAYQAGQPLHLAMYSSDVPMHTGKYFFSSKVDDYSAQSRPTLTIVWGDP